MKKYDVFYTRPGSSEDMCCAVCGTRCNVRRNVYGPTCYAAAVAKLNIYSDIFTCPHSGKDWHEQALKLTLKIEKTPSKRGAEMMKLDLEDLLRENGSSLSSTTGTGR